MNETQLAVGLKEVGRSGALLGAVVREVDSVALCGGLEQLFRESLALDPFDASGLASQITVRVERDLARLREANPYHGEDGRFASKDGGVAPGGRASAPASASKQGKELAKAIGTRAAGAAAAAIAGYKLKQYLGRFLPNLAGGSIGKEMVSTVGGAVGDILGAEFGISRAASREIGSLVARHLAKAAKDKMARHKGREKPGDDLFDVLGGGS